MRLTRTTHQLFKSKQRSAANDDSGSLALHQTASTVNWNVKEHEGTFRVPFISPLILDVDETHLELSPKGDVYNWKGKDRHLARRPATNLSLNQSDQRPI